MSGASTCPASHSRAMLSWITMFLCCLLFLSTAFLNSIIIYIVVKDRRSKFKLFFYKLLLNISVADALTGIITDTVYIGMHIKEAVYYEITEKELMFAHMIMFMLSGVSLITLVYLCIDRIFAILHPFAYRKGLSERKSQCVIISSWLLSAMQASTYLFIGFMKFLVVFTVFNVTIPFCILALTVFVYHNKLMKNIQNDDPDNQSAEGANLQKSTPKSRKKGRRATLSFLKMLLVFILSYLPACVITIYFNVCKVCNCMLIDILRDVAVLLILSGSLFRAMNFIITLKSLRKEAAELFGIKAANSSLPESSDNAQK